MQPYMMGDTAPAIADALLGIYDRLLGHYGPQHWWPAETRLEMIVGAILTQSVAWSNVEKAIGRLKENDLLRPDRLRSVSDEELAEMIRSSGYFRAKARKIKAFVAHLHEHYHDDLDQLFAKAPAVLREELLSIYGVGPETADSIILYAAFKPVFVIDAYTRRLMPRLGLAPDGVDYDTLQTFFEANLPMDADLFNEYHALIVRHSNRTCLKKPLCAGCPLVAVCQLAGLAELPT